MLILKSDDQKKVMSFKEGESKAVSQNDRALFSKAFKTYKKVGWLIETKGVEKKVKATVKAPTVKDKPVVISEQVETADPEVKPEVEVKPKTVETEAKPKTEEVKPEVKVKPKTRRSSKKVTKKVAKKTRSRRTK